MGVPKSKLIRVLTEYPIVAWSINGMSYDKFLSVHKPHINPNVNKVTFKFYLGETDTLDFKGCLPSSNDSSLLEHYNSRVGLDPKEVHLIKCLMSDLKLSLKDSVIETENDEQVIISIEKSNKNNPDIKWKPIEGYDGKYLISNDGQVLSFNNIYKYPQGHLLSPKKNTTGHLQVSLAKNGEIKIFLVHRLVAQHFIPNPDDLPIINHRDEVKTNNHVSNLEWTTYKYNLKYSGNTRKAHEANKKPVLQYTKEGVFIKKFSSIKEAQIETGISSIYDCISNKCKSAGGFLWRLQQ